MKSHKSTSCTLGIAATARTVQAVLLQQGPDGPEVLRRFSRPRSRGVAPLSPSGVTPAAAEFAQEAPGAGQDFTIQFGDVAAGGRELFLASEFAGLDKEGGDELGVAGPVATFEFELRDLLDECRDSGYPDPVVGFALAAGDMAFFELRVTDPPKNRKLDDAYLLEMLGHQYKGPVEQDRVAFIPMTPGDEGVRRFLALFPKASDPVTATLRTIRDSKEPLPQVRLFDAEVALLVGLARQAQRQLRAEPDEPAEAMDPMDEAAYFFMPRRPALPPEGQPIHTLVVRAGMDDTLVLFMQGEVLYHCETLRSLTAFDSPETLCSRVLLQQDEHGMGDVHHVLLLSEERRPDLLETFEMFFPDARVELLQDYLPAQEEYGDNSPVGIATATAVALRLLDNPDGAFENVNFIPRKLATRGVRLPITWQMMALGAVTVFTTLFFLVSYSNGASEIESYRSRINLHSEGDMSTDLQVLQASIDSMEALHQTYLRSLQVLDTLLVGSDRWSRVLEKTARDAAIVKGVWIESMTPSGNTLQLTGTATARDNVVAFARRLDATINSLVFSEIREWPVYSFELQVVVKDELPAAARYLREQVEIPGDATAATQAPTIRQ